MEYQIFGKIKEKIELGQKVALATLIEKTGTSPGKPGMLMAVFEDKTTLGTVGGGNTELNTIKSCVKRIESEKSGIEIFQNKCCKGTDEKTNENRVVIFINIFIPKEKLFIVGCGHVGSNFYNVAKTQNFDIYLFDDREGFCNKDKFPTAKTFNCDVKKELEKVNIDKNTYIVLCRHNHKADEEALEMVIGKGAKYIGMLGSKKKVESIKNNLREKGYGEKDLKEIVSPIGIDIGSSIPSELAIGIMAQILIRKNNGDIKTIEKQV